MANDSLVTLVNAIESVLDGDTLWASRIHFGSVQPDETYPYVWITMQAGMDRDQDFFSDPMYILAIQGVSLGNQSKAFECKQRIYELLDNTAEQDQGSGLSGDADWHILTATRTEDIYFEDLADRAKRIYRAGNQYEFMMEAKS